MKAPCIYRGYQCREPFLFSVKGTYPMNGIRIKYWPQRKEGKRTHPSEEKYRTILHGIEEGYYEVDLAGNMTFFNDSMCRIVGYPRDELTGMNNRRYMSQDTAKKVYQTFNEVYRTGKPKKAFEWELIRKDGTKRFVEVSVSLRGDSKGCNQRILWDRTGY